MDFGPCLSPPGGAVLRATFTANKWPPDTASDAILYFTPHLTNGSHIIGTQRISVDYILSRFSSPNMIKILCISTHGKGWKLGDYYPQIQALLSTYCMPGTGLGGGGWGLHPDGKGEIS